MGLVHPRPERGTLIHRNDGNPVSRRQKARTLGGQRTRLQIAPLVEISMNTPIGLTRQQHLQQLEFFLDSLKCQVAKESGGQDGLLLLRQCLSGECVQCGLTVTGDDLLAILDPSSTSNPKQNRLRQGYCARRGCPSYYYRLYFGASPGLDWNRILTETEVLPVTASPITSDADAEGAITSGSGFYLGKARFAVMVVLLVVTGMVLAFQWHRGGTIPLLRVPEQFEVDTLPDQAR
jgi:hypothetical protein